jgi:hypothetical protein
MECPSVRCPGQKDKTGHVRKCPDVRWLERPHIIPPNTNEANGLQLFGSAAEGFAKGVLAISFGDGTLLAVLLPKSDPDNSVLSGVVDVVGCNLACLIDGTIEGADAAAAKAMDGMLK